MSKLFFDHLILREEIDTQLDTYHLELEDRQELIDIIDQTITSHILNLILNHLPKEKHGDFVSAFTSAPHDAVILDFLRLHAHPEIEDKIRDQSRKIKKDILDEIKRSSRKH